MDFRRLRADEIEVRVGMTRETGAQLLLYKDARCDMNILDETVGNENWQREHYECKNKDFCKVGININFAIPDSPPLWVYKSDCGAESFSDKEKGEASDSFKRACVNWGIGRELYSAPFIWIVAAFLGDKLRKNNKGKFEVKERFSVSEIAYGEGKEARIIKYLKIIAEDGRVAYTFGKDERICPQCEKPLSGRIIKGEYQSAENILSKLGMCETCYRKAKAK